MTTTPRDRTCTARRIRLRVAVLCAVVGAAGFADGAVLHVRAGATGAGTGASWADAFGDLQMALASARAGDQVWVASGVYKPAPAGGARDATFLMSNSVVVYGGFAGFESSAEQRDPSVNEAILSGDLNGDDGAGFTSRGDNSYHVVTVLAGGPVVDGFTIAAGHASGPGFGATPASQDQGSGANVYDSTPTFRRCVFRENWSANHGALNDHGSTTLEDCAFIGNYATLHGAGLYMHHHSETRAVRCRFMGNTTPGDGGGIYSRGLHGPQVLNCIVSGNTAVRGAGMYIAEGANPIVSACEFAENIAELGGGGIYNDKCLSRISFCEFRGNRAGEMVGGGGAGSGGSGGGGVWATTGAPIVESCTFTDNAASFGGGFYAIEESAAVVSNCLFTRNSAAEAGGLYALSSPVLVTRCTFIGNRAFGSEFSVGGGVSSYFSNNRVENCVFIGNTAFLGGGGAYAEGESPVMMNCLFVGNRTTGHEQGWGGGLLNGYHTFATIAGCAFIGNQADEGGGAFTMVFADPLLVNCTFYVNAANAPGALAGGVFCSEFTNVRVTNCIAWGNSDGQVIGTTTVSHSCVEGGLAGPGNTASPPNFVRLPSPGADGAWGTDDDELGDLRLAAGSPCIDSGDSRFTGALAAGFGSDLGGGPRRVDDPATADTGVGPEPAVDMGAYEFAPPVCVADMDDGSGTGMPDGGVTIEDLLFFIGVFEAGDGRADVDDGSGTGTRDGGVTIDDLLFYLLRFEAGC